jgi:D-tagatose-1,6-bisphosphate aldolase subunit GatZ/KbaZ
MYLTDIIAAHKKGAASGIPSLCSAHPAVLKAAMQGDGQRLIESTCNQVNQFGGYTGMTPADFVRFVYQIAEMQNFPVEKIILGGDHLGPNVWQKEPAQIALEKSADMMRAYIQAGYQKIHLDCSMRLADDPPGHLDPEVSAQRSAWLAKVAENARDNNGPAPLYVIGTEVPVPGGALDNEEGVHVTLTDDLARTLESTHLAFLKEGLISAWERVIAVVVQPGVDFGDDFVQSYNPDQAALLSQYIVNQHMVYEAHSTDYQTPLALQELVRDHFAILKVGPELTFAYREAIFGLAQIEEELIEPGQRSHFLTVLEDTMVQDPVYWQGYYHGDAKALYQARKYSLSDRVRYYWQYPQVQAALTTLMNNLKQAAPTPGLVSQFVNWQRPETGVQAKTFHPENVITDRIQQILQKYDSACGR